MILGVLIYENNNNKMSTPQLHNPIKRTGWQPGHRGRDTGDLPRRIHLIASGVG